jgi:hypothetical protein
VINDSQFTWAIFKVLSIIGTAVGSQLILAWLVVRKWHSKEARRPNSR